MALINFARKEIEAKVVYYGPAFSGKTTNVEALHGLVPEAQRGDLHQLQTEEERTIYFDYIPLALGQIAGFTARFKLFTVPGQVFYKETRRVLLQGADAVVFVADSSPDRGGANVDSLLDLQENLLVYGLDLQTIPLVIQFNKRDVPGARAIAEMMDELNPFGVPFVEAVASEGRGVMEALTTVTDIAGARIRENIAGKATAISLTAIAKTKVEDDKEIVRQHVEAIREVRPREQARGEQARQDIDPAALDQFLLENVERDDEPTPVGLRKVAPPPSRQGADVRHIHPVATSTARPPEPAREAPREAPKEAPKAPERPRVAVGPALSCTYDPSALTGMRVLEWRAGSIAPDGKVSLSVVTNQGGTLKEHPLSLVPTAAPPQGLAAMSAVAALAVGGALGLLLGLAIGFASFG